MTINRHSKYSVFTVNNYCAYQQSDTQADKQVTGNRQSSDSQATTIEERKKERKKEYKDTNVSIHRPSDIRQIMEAWNDLERYGIKPVCKLNRGSQRLQNLTARIKEYGEAEVLRAIENVKHSEFLQGKTDGRWQITFDWFVKPNNFPKVLEGQYEESRSSQKAVRNNNNFERRRYDMDELESQLLNSN